MLISVIQDVKKKTMDETSFQEIKTRFFKLDSTITYSFFEREDEYVLVRLIKRLNVEQLKKKLSYVINALPCEECKQHSLHHMNANRIFESSSFFYIFHFFLELRNRFYENEIKRTLFNTRDDLLKNESFLFSKLMNTSL